LVVLFNYYSISFSTLVESPFSHFYITPITKGFSFKAVANVELIFQGSNKKKKKINK